MTVRTIPKISLITTDWAFLYLTLPTWTNANPSYIKMIMNPERRIQSTSKTLSSFKTGSPEAGSAAGAGGAAAAAAGAGASAKCLCISSVI